MKRHAGFSADEFLDATPIANQAVKEQAISEDRVVLVVPVRKRWFNSVPFTWLFYFRSERRLELDALGTQVWRMADGVHTTEQIIEAFAAEHRLSFHEARVCVTQFLRMLTERNLVAMVGRRTD